MVAKSSFLKMFLDKKYGFTEKFKNKWGNEVCQVKKKQSKVRTM